MKASELIKKLQEIIKKKGDVNVECWHPSGYIELVEKVTVIENTEEKAVILLE